MSSGDKAAHRGGHAAEVVGASVPDADEEAARRLRKVYANRASAARSKERKKAITTLEQQVPFLLVVWICFLDVLAGCCRGWVSAIAPSCRRLSACFRHKAGCKRYEPAHDGMAAQGAVYKRRYVICKHQMLDLNAIQVRMLEQQTTAQATEIFGLKAANHALRAYSQLLFSWRSHLCTE
jgi:hypothetical protein